MSEIARPIPAVQVNQHLGCEGDAALHDIKAVDGSIAMTVHGQLAWDHNKRDFAVAIMNNNDSAPQVFLRKPEQKK